MGREMKRRSGRAIPHPRLSGGNHVDVAHMVVCMIEIVNS